MRPTNASRIAILGISVMLAGVSSWAQTPSVTHRNGLLTIECSGASLSSVFESIEREAGIELILEDAVKSKTLSANLIEVPVAMAVQRLLEGAGVNYIVMMDPSNWGRVEKIFVGAGGGGPARAALPRGPVVSEPTEEEYAEEPLEGDVMEAFDALGVDADALSNPDFEVPPENPEDFGGEVDPGGFPAPPGSSALPDFFPPSQNFPRSNFTPGLPGANRRAPGGATQPEPGPDGAPPATFPFTDPFGRPIPIPPGMNPNDPSQQRQRQQQQQQE